MKKFTQLKFEVDEIKLFCLNVLRKIRSYRLVEKRVTKLERKIELLEHKVLSMQDELRGYHSERT